MNATLSSSTVAMEMPLVMTLMEVMNVTAMTGSMEMEWFVTILMSVQLICLSVMLKLSV